VDPNALPPLPRPSRGSLAALPPARLGRADRIRRDASRKLLTILAELRALRREPRRTR